MKRIEAIIRPHKVPMVLTALAEFGITNVTVLETLGMARQITFSRIYEAASPNREMQTGLIPKRMLLIFTEDALVQPVVDLIQKTARTGEAGDGKIAVSELVQITRIRPKVKAAAAK